MYLLVVVGRSSFNTAVWSISHNKNLYWTSTLIPVYEHYFNKHVKSFSTTEISAFFVGAINQNLHLNTIAGFFSDGQEAKQICNPTQLRYYRTFCAAHGVEGRGKVCQQYIFPKGLVSLPRRSHCKWFKNQAEPFGKEGRK